MGGISSAERAELALLVREFFAHDETKVRAWWTTPNPMLGNTSPAAMTIVGLEDKLLRFVKESIAEGGLGAR